MSSFLIIMMARHRGTPRIRIYILKASRSIGHNACGSSAAHNTCSSSLSAGHNACRSSAGHNACSFSAGHNACSFSLSAGHNACGSSTGHNACSSSAGRNACSSSLRGITQRRPETVLLSREPFDRIRESQQHTCEVCVCDYVRERERESE